MSQQPKQPETDRFSALILIAGRHEVSVLPVGNIAHLWHHPFF
jgi:hypothetical protein